MSHGFKQTAGVSFAEAKMFGKRSKADTAVIIFAQIFHHGSDKGSLVTGALVFSFPLRSGKKGELVKDLQEPDADEKLIAEALLPEGGINLPKAGGNLLFRLRGRRQNHRKGFGVR